MTYYYVYFSVLLLSWLCAEVYNEKNFTTIMLVVAIVFASFFIGFRADDVGADTISYKLIYLSITPLDEVFSVGTFGYLAQRVEIGFVCFASFFRMLGADRKSVV